MLHLFFSCYLMNLKPRTNYLENGSKERFKIMIQKNDLEELLGEKQRRERENEKGTDSGRRDRKSRVSE